MSKKLFGFVLFAALFLSLFVAPAMAFPPIGMRYSFYNNAARTTVVGQYTYCPSITYVWGTVNTPYRSADCNPYCPLREAAYCEELL